MVSLPWTLPRANFGDLVAFVVSRINSRRTLENVSNVAPRVQFAGRKMRHEKEFELKFGDYREVADPTVINITQYSRSVESPRT